MVKRPTSTQTKDLIAGFRGLTKRKIAKATGRTRATIRSNQSVGRTYLGASNMREALVVGLQQSIWTLDDIQPGPPQEAHLSPREAEVARLIAQGFMRPEIAGIMNVKLSTVRTHCENLYSKLGAHSQVEVLVWALKTGMLSQDEAC